MSVTDPTGKFEAHCSLHLFTRAVGAAAVLSDDFRLQVRKDGLSTLLVDNANVAMVGFHIPAGALASYEAKTEGEFCLDAKKLLGLLDLLHSVYPAEDRRIGLRTVPTEGVPGVGLEVSANGAACTFNALESRGVRKTAKLPPSEDYRGAATITGQELHWVCNVAEKFSEYLVLEVKKGMSDVLFIRAKGDDGRFEMVRTGLMLTGPVKAEEFKSAFSLDYLSDISTFLAKDPDGKFTLYIGNDYPLRIEGPLLHNVGTLRFLLAPRFESEGE